MTTFKELGLSSDIIKGLDDLGFIEPSPIQAKAIPFVLNSKKDLTALAQTGTGKTAAFGLPILNQIKTNNYDIQAIILCPTRELCLQISQDLQMFAKYQRGISVTPVYGGERIDFQIKALKKGTNIVVGTPGRVHDLIRRKVLKLQSINWLVLDEADEMLDMGFKDDLDAILGETSSKRQTLLFSATMSKSVANIAKQYMSEAEEISAGEKNIGAEKVSHEYYVVQPRDRFEALKRILDFLPGVYGILFCRTRREAQEIADKLKKSGYDTEALHGEISQNMRTKIMDRFKRKQVRLLVATDVAARGIDVSDLSHVLNYNMPDQNAAYVHRSGRTGRAQKSGVSVSIITARETRKIKELERIIGKGFERKQIPNSTEVCLKQINSFIEEVTTTDISDNKNEKLFEDIIEKLKKTKKEDLIKQFLTNKFKHLMDDHRGGRDLNSKEKAPRERMADSDSVSLKINLGKRQGMDVKGIFGLLNSNKALKGIEVGKISLMADYSIFSVEKSAVERVLSFLEGDNYKGKKISIQKSNVAASSSYDGSGRRRGRGGYPGKRKSQGGYQEKRRREAGRGFKRNKKKF